MKNRIASLMFAALIFCSLLLQSCAERNNSAVAEESSAASAAVTETAETSAEETETVSEYIEDDLEPADLGGYNFRIYSVEFLDKELGEYITYEELTGDMVNDELYNAKINTEERFNFHISIIRNPGNDVDHAARVRNIISSGDDVFDIQIGQDTRTVEVSKDGLFYNLMNVPQFNFDKPWWTKNAVENLSVKDKMYVASSYLSYCGLSYTRVLTINKDKMEELGREMPYQTVRDGNWTLDKMIELVEDVSVDLNGDGKMTKEDDYFGLATGIQTWYCMQDSVGLLPYTKNSEDEFELSLDIDKTEQFVDKVRYLINDSGAYIEDETGFGADVFSNNQSLMALTQIKEAHDRFRESDFIYGIIPTPKLDENQKEYISSCTDTFWTIPVTAANHINEIGTIIEAMSCYNYNKVLPLYFETVLSKKIADSPDDAEMLKIIRDTRTISFAYAYGLEFSHIIDNTAKKEKSFATYYAAKEKFANKTLEKLMDRFDKLS